MQVIRHCCTRRILIWHDETMKKGDNLKYGVENILVIRRHCFPFYGMQIKFTTEIPKKISLLQSNCRSISCSYRLKLLKFKVSSLVPPALIRCSSLSRFIDANPASNVEILSIWSASDLVFCYQIKSYPLSRQSRKISFIVSRPPHYFTSTQNLRISYITVNEIWFFKLLLIIKWNLTRKSHLNFNDF